MAKGKMGRKTEREKQILRVRKKEKRIRRTRVPEEIPDLVPEDPVREDALEVRRHDPAREDGLEIRRQDPVPEDVVMLEILTRLPAKSLMKFKCVSKEWSSLIRSQYFNNRFLKVQSQPLPRIFMSFAEPNLSSPKSSQTLSFAPKDNSATYFWREHEQTLNPQNPQMGGSIVRYGPFLCYTFKLKPRIFNPITRQVVTLPAATQHKPLLHMIGLHEKCVNYYFGQDPVNGQLKGLCSYAEFKPDKQRIFSEHWVLVREGSGSPYWKKAVPDIPRHVSIKGGLCIDGVIYYLSNDAFYNLAVVCFDVISEEFSMIQVPPSDDYHQLLLDRYYNVTLIEYGGKVTIFDKTNLALGVVDLWVLQGKEWSRKTQLVRPSQLHFVKKINHDLRVKGTTQKGRVLLYPGATLCSRFYILCYDLDRNYMRKIQVRGIPNDWFNRLGEIRLDIMFMDHQSSLEYLNY